MMKKIVAIICMIGISGIMISGCGGSSTEWEYRIMDLGGIGDEGERKLNTAGEEGWEVASQLSSYTLVLKRSK